MVQEEEQEHAEGVEVQELEEEVGLEQERELLEVVREVRIAVEEVDIRLRPKAPQVLFPRTLEKQVLLADVVDVSVLAWWPQQEDAWLAFEEQACCHRSRRRCPSPNLSCNPRGCSSARVYCRHHRDGSVVV